jgi:tRNA pseudouridine55 synthase
VLVDKPAGITSHDAVSAARRAFATRRIGHAGTLDPFATGLLVLLVNHATRLLPHLDGEPKSYDAVIAFGAETETDDGTGLVTRTADLPLADAVRAGIQSLTGALEQRPPAFSAKQVDGQRAYDAARRGAPLELQPVGVTVHQWVIRGLTPERLEATITCGGGTYIRALARDLGRLCGSAAHLVALRRTRSGSFDVAHASSLGALSAGTVTLRPPIDAVPHLLRVVLSSVEVADVRLGRPVSSVVTRVDDNAAKAALTDDEGRLVAVAERVGGKWQPRVVLPDA